jgi:hypothetical protein
MPGPPSPAPVAFAFGAPAAAQLAPPSLFSGSFGAVAPSLGSGFGAYATAAGGPADDDGGALAAGCFSADSTPLTARLADDEQERPPSPSLVRGGGEDDALQTLHEVKTKLFFQKDKAWTERGVGLLQLKRPKDGGGAARLLMRSETGKLWLNANLYTGLKVVQNAKGILLTLDNVVDEGGAAERVMTYDPVTVNSAR